jgi:MYXO-CTERM domain-containing protein
VCKDAFTVQALNGAETSCAPYKCVAGGCQQQCVKDSDCADGYGCAQSACVRSGAGAAGANSGSSSTGGGPRSADSGCGCRLASKPDAPLHSGAVSLLAGSGLAAWARRRSARKGTRAPAKN